ncbi:1-hydroxycarotenoid 3,4-desaturase CrtD [Pontivivens ytuae]|uniref:Phytoene desaturase n=1 Tax=Pontivivens ytuae TaxID=2789856 RepID=A0A7S9LRZ4_9RHOB|nr:1-hydroxycarotenoid 3,4-desaturase CrtD [Pontivivens ytuae]QPH54204.1 phytoene desaturase [Pontivivens ytuae]
MQQQPTLIVGAGIGGLAAAVVLSAAGERVILIDRHDHPGGKMRAVPTMAGPADAGPTVLTMRSVFDRICAAAGTRLEDHVRLRSAPIVARHFWTDGSTLDLSGDPAQDSENVAAFGGPEAARAFQRFHAEATQLFEAFEGPMMQAPRPRLGPLALAAARPALLPALAPRSLAQHLARRFEDPRLRQLFGRYATYVGGRPDAAPAVLALIWAAEAQGVWAVDGGMHRLAEALADIAVSRGAELWLGCHVAGLEVEGGHATGVTLSDGTRIAAGRVLFNGDPAALRHGLLGPTACTAVPRAAVTPRSLSAHVWSFAAQPQGRPLAHHNVFFGADPRTEFGPLAHGAMPEDPTLYVCAQDRGTGTPDGPERFEIIMNAPPATGPTTEEEIARCRKETFATLMRHGLSFDPEPPDSTLTTPADFATLFPGSDGSLYGRSPHGLMAPFRRPTARSRITGLYLCGGGVHPGAGVPMAARSGLHAAEAILSDRASTSTSPQTATPGGTWTGSATAGATASRSSPS